jgi:hypothetical protein
MEYTLAELQSALSKAEANPEKYGKHISELKRLIASGAFKGENLGSNGNINDPESGSLVFDELNNDQSYNDALMKFYSGRAGGTVNTINQGKGFRETATLSDHQSIDRDSSGNITMSPEQLKEKSFELFNSAMLNEVSLIRFGNEINLMSKEERDNLSYLFDVYERTKITGEGSRSGFEQFKDAGNLLTAPSTYVGGVGVFGRAVGKGAFGPVMKKMLKTGFKSLTKPEQIILKEGRKEIAKKSAGVGALYAGGFDAAQQAGIEMQLDPDQKFSGGRLALATGLGGAAGYVLPKAIPLAGKILRAPASIINKNAMGAGKIHKYPQKIGDALVRSFGGGPGAKRGVADEGKAKFGANTYQDSDGNIDTMDVTQHGLNIKNEVIQASQKAFDNFKEAFQSLGELKIKFGSKDSSFNFDTGLPSIKGQGAFDDSLSESKDSVFRLMDYILGEKTGAPKWEGLKNIRFLLERGDIGPTEALRKIRSAVGGATTDNSEYVKQLRPVFIRLNKEVRKVFSDSAKRTGKGEEFELIDRQYSDFLKVNNHAETQKLMKEDSSQAIKMLKTLSSTAKGNKALLDEHNTRLQKLSDYSSTRVNDVLDESGNLIKPGESIRNQTLEDSSAAAIRGILGDQMFSGESAKGFKTYLSTQQGRDVLKKIYPEQKETVDRLSKVMEAAADKPGVGMFAMRLMTAALTGGIAVTGQLGSAAITGLGYVAIETLLRSKWFAKQAVKVFGRDKNKSAIEAIKLVGILERKGIPKEHANKILETMLGSAAWAYILSNEDRRDNISNASSKIGNAALGGIQEFGRLANEKTFQPVFDTVSDMLIRDN